MSSFLLPLFLLFHPLFLLFHSLFLLPPRLLPSLSSSLFPPPPRLLPSLSSSLFPPPPPHHHHYHPHHYRPHHYRPHHYYPPPLSPMIPSLSLQLYPIDARSVPTFQQLCRHVSASRVFWIPKSQHASYATRRLRESRYHDVETHKA